MTAWILEYFALPALALSLALASWRALRGRSLGDRVVGLDLMTTITIGLAGAVSMQSGQKALLDVGLVIALIAFLSTVGFAFFLGRRSAFAQRSRLQRTSQLEVQA